MSAIITRRKFVAIQTLLFFAFNLFAEGLISSSGIGNQSDITQDTLAQNAYFRILPYLLKPEFDAGRNPGDNTQYMRSFGYSESDPDRIYQAHDMGGVWVSLDAGSSWNNLRNKGLHSRYMVALEVDPLDKNRVLAMAQAAGDKPHEKYQGIYLTKDGGLHWSRVLAWQNVFAHNSDNIAYAPSSKNALLGYATRWYAVFDTYNGAKDGLCYSDDGGETLTTVRSLPSTAFGDQITGIRVHPTNPNVLFLYGNNGLFMFNQATNPSGTINRLSGKNGLPEGNVSPRLYISPTGDVLIACLSGKGIYKSLDSGNSWVLLYSWPSIRNAFVNEGYPDVIYATPTRESGEQLRVTKNGGNSWNTNVSSTPVPGFSGKWNTHIVGTVIPHPLNADRAFAHGHAKHHQTNNGGDSWIPSNDYFNGSAWGLINQEQMFDPVNPDRFGYFMIDKGVSLTDTRGKWFYESKVDKVALSLEHTTSAGAALHPIASTRIILVSMGKQNGELLRSENDGSTWTKVRTGSKHRWFISFDQQNPDYCYQYRERSEDTGKTWIDLPMPAGTIICGMSFTDGRVLYAIDVDTDQKNIYRSDNRGDTWTKVISTSWKLTSPTDKKYTFRVHPANHNIVFTSASNGQISKWDLEKPLGEQRIDLDVLNGVAMEEGFYIDRLAIDRRFPDVMYAVNVRDNTGNKLFRTLNGGVSWQNISENFPNQHVNGIEVSPVTGEVYLSSGNGSRVLLPPYPTQNTAWEQVTYKYNFIKDEQGFLVNGGGVSVQSRKEAPIINAYPNPSGGFFTLNISDDENISEYTVFNLMGKVMKCGSFLPGQRDLDLTDMAKGVYVLRINAGQDEIINRIVII